MREISLKTFLHTMYDSCQNDRRYCFILGAGASRESGIQTGEELAEIWYKEICDRYTQSEIEEKMKELHIRDITPSSKNYFDIYDLRFYPDYHNGYSYLEKVMEKAQPSFGYYPLAMLLASTDNNLVVTTNFDSLVEDALFIYTDKKPIVAGHEQLAEYININTKRPIVAKIHRGLFFKPFNRKEELNGLSENWKKVLKTAFQVFIPVVIGYAGGDMSLMEFLKDTAVEMRQGFYWCYRHEKPSREIMDLVEEKGGYFVPIEGFDEMMFMLGETFSYSNPRERIMGIAQKRVELYEKQFKAFSSKMKAIQNPTERQSQVLDSLKQTSSKELEQLTEKIQLHPEEYQTYLFRAKIYDIRGEYEKAIADCESAIQINPKADTAYSQLGDIYLSQGKDYEKAKESFAHAITLNADMPKYYLERGYAYSKLKQYRKAIEDFSVTIALDPESAEAYFLRGEAYADLKQYEEAVKDLSEAISLDPLYWRAYHNRGYLYNILGQYENAIDDFQTAIQIDPNKAASYRHLGYAFFLSKQYENALTELNRAIELDPDSMDFYQLRAEIYQGLGKFERAQLDLKQARKLGKQAL